MANMSNQLTACCASAGIGSPRGSDYIQRIPWKRTMAMGVEPSGQDAEETNTFSNLGIDLLIISVSDFFTLFHH